MPLQGFRSPRKGVGKACRLPFTFNGEEFTSCTAKFDKDGNHWCATKTDDSGKLVRGNWGYCDCAAEPLVAFQPKAVLPVAKPDELGTWLPDPDKGECGRNVSPGYIVGGEEADIGQIPMMALLGYRRSGEIFYACGGTLINRRYVLTAAHCHQNRRGKRIREVVLGEHDVDSELDCGDVCVPVQRFEIGRGDVLQHEAWSLRRFTRGNDIALVRLPRLARLHRLGEVAVRPVPACLPWKPTTPDDSELGFAVAGWGRVSNDPQNTTSTTGVAKSGVLLYARMPLITAEECRKVPGFNVVRPGIHVCAGGEVGSLPQFTV